MRLESGRDRFEQPGLMAALDEGGQCDGVVLRIPAELVDQETEFIWRREMFAGAYRPIFLHIDTPQGPVNALVFVMDRHNRRYTPNVPDDDAARMIAMAEGNIGPNIDYLDSLIRQLDDLGISEDHMRNLYTMARAYRY